jgi:hypothetical protein
MVDLELVPYPRLKHPEVVVREFGMADGLLRRQYRVAVVGCLHRLRGVDCTEAHEMNTEAHRLWLKMAHPLRIGKRNLHLLADDLACSGIYESDNYGFAVKKVELLHASAGK